jgi:hypothetical protein
MEEMELEEERLKLNAQYEIFLTKHGNPISILELKLLVFLRELEKLPDRTYTREITERIPLDKKGKEIPLGKDGKPKTKAKSWKVKGHTVKVVGKDRQNIDFWILRLLFPQIAKYHLEKKLRFRYGTRLPKKNRPKAPDILPTYRYWKKKGEMRARKIPREKRSFEYQVERAIKGFLHPVKGMRKLAMQNKSRHAGFNKLIEEFKQRLEEMKL